MPPCVGPSMASISRKPTWQHPEHACLTDKCLGATALVESQPDPGQLQQRLARKDVAQNGAATVFSDSLTGGATARAASMIVP